MKAVMYHYVQRYSEALPHLRFLDFENFRKQLDFFESNYGFVTSDEWCRYVSDASLPSPDGKILLTFDDSLSCHHKYVFPELRSRNLWGIFYVPSSPYTEGRLLDVHRIHLLCGAFDGRELLNYARAIVSDEATPFAIDEQFQKKTYSAQVNEDGVSEFKRLLNYFADADHRSDIIDAIAKKFGFNFDLPDYYMSTHQIREMAAAGMLIGSHTRTHPVMSTLSFEDQRLEINSSFDFLSLVCPLPLRTYCHPYGGSHSFNEHTVQLLNDSRVDFSFSVESRAIAERDHFDAIQFLPRFDCNEFPFGRAS